MSRTGRSAADVLGASALPLAADGFQLCNLLPDAISPGVDPTRVGPAACAKLCRDTEGCIDWAHTPDGDAPETVPGECRTLPDVLDDEGSETDFCGFLDEDANG